MSILKVRDEHQQYYIQKDVMSSLPCRTIICGKSALSGKTNLLINILANPDDKFYSDHFLGENLYLISGSIKSDDKLQRLISFKEIPEKNLVHGYSEEELIRIYKEIEEKHHKAISEKETVHYMVIMDDCSFGGGLKKKINGIISKYFSNSRHINCSIIITLQKYSDCLTSARENASSCFFFQCSNKQMSLISEDVNYTDNTKSFNNMFREAVKEPHSFLFVNFFKPVDEMYMNSDFEVIKL